MLGDSAIGGAGSAAVDGAQHLPRALTPLRSNARVGRHVLSPDSRPETRHSGQAVRRELIENNERGERFAVWPIGNGDIEALAAHVQPNERGVLFEDGVDTQIVSGKAEAIGPRRTPFEADCSRIGLWGPEDRLGKSGGVWIGPENTTPIAGQILRPSRAAFGRKI